MSDHQSNALHTDLLIELELEQWPTDRPKPYARNARKITDKAVDKVAASIREFGFRQPIVVDQDGVIIVGHARLLAAQRLKLATVPVHVASTLTPAQVKAYRLADNRTNEETDWDLKLLATEFADLKSLDLDLSLTGFDPDELELQDPVEQPRDEKGRYSNKKAEQPATGQDPVPTALGFGFEFPQATCTLDAAAIARWQASMFENDLNLHEALSALRDTFPAQLVGGCRLRLSIEPLE